MLGKFSTIISSKIFSHPFFFFSSSGTPIINSNVGVFDMVPEVSETVFSSFHSLYFILLFRIYFHNFIFQLSNLCFLNLIGYFLFHVGEIFNYNLFKIFLIPFLFLFVFWDPYNSNVGAFSLSLSSVLFILTLFYSSEIISTTLSSSLLIRSSASDILLLIPSRVFLISVIVLFVSACLFLILLGLC